MQCLSWCPSAPKNWYLIGRRIKPKFTSWLIKCLSDTCLQNNSILLHSGLNPAWHFWLSTRFSCCLKMKSVENILGYIREQFYRFSRGCKPRENLWNCSRKYTKMFKTDSFLGNKKLSLNQNVWRDHATMQQDVLLHFWVIFLHWNQAEIWKNYSVVQL